MRCSEYRGAFLAGELGGEHTAHLATCSSCRAERAHLEEVRTVLDEPILWEEPSSDLGDRVIAGILVEAGRTSSTASGRRWRLVAGGIAAALVVVVGVAGYLSSRPADPDWEVLMPGTELAAGAEAVVQGWVTPSGHRIVMEVTGLDPAPQGTVYEMWFSSEDIHLSAGSFTDSGEVEMWIGVRRADFPRLWVTVEPIDADAAPSGPTVLDTG